MNIIILFSSKLLSRQLKEISLQEQKLGVSIFDKIIVIFQAEDEKIRSTYGLKNRIKYMDASKFYITEPYGFHNLIVEGGETESLARLLVSLKGNGNYWHPYPSVSYYFKRLESNSLEVAREGRSRIKRT